MKDCSWKACVHLNLSMSLSKLIEPTMYWNCAHQFCCRSINAIRYLLLTSWLDMQDCMTRSNMLLFALECGWNARRFWSGWSNFNMIIVLQLHVRPTFGVSHAWSETWAEASGADFQSNKWCNRGSGSAQHLQNAASAGNSTSQSAGFSVFLAKIYK